MTIPPSLALFPLFVALAPAAVVNIDFNHSPAIASYNGRAEAPDLAGDDAIWNSVVRPGSDRIIHSGPLVDSEGHETSVLLTLGINGSATSAGDQELGGVSGEYLGLMADYFYINSSTDGTVVSKTGSISGLIPSNSYDLYFYSQGDNFAGGYKPGQNGLFTIGGSSKQTGWDNLVGGDGQFIDGIEFVMFTQQADATGKIEFIWSNVIAGPGGNVDVDLDGKGSIYSALNALQIVDSQAGVIPEPTTTLFSGLAWVALLFRRRRD